MGMCLCFQNTGSCEKKTFEDVRVIEFFKKKISSIHFFIFHHDNGWKSTSKQVWKCSNPEGQSEDRDWSGSQDPDYMKNLKRPQKTITPGDAWHIHQRRKRLKDLKRCMKLSTNLHQPLQSVIQQTDAKLTRMFWVPIMFTS